MECEFTSESFRFLVTSLGAGLVLGGIAGLVIGLWKVISDDRKRPKGSVSLPTRGSHATNPFVEQGTGPELDDMVKPIPERSVMYGRCGPQPLAFAKGSETLCPECRAKVNETGKMTYCARLFPIAYTWRD